MQALLEAYPVTPESLGAVDAKIAIQYKVFPLFVKADVIHVASAEELSAESLERLSHILGKQVVVMVVSDQHVSRLIRLHYEGIEESLPANSSQADLEKPEEAGKRISDINKVWESIEESRVERSLSRQGYSLSIEADQIMITATAGAGLFYGMQTLIQLVRQYGHRLPALRIEDKPDFRWRGFLLDVSRGRVPTLDTLKWLVRTLSHFKINMLQLYVEHTFHFESHPEIGEGCSPLEPDEIRELDHYCKSRHVELVPSLQSFGHMGYMLSLPKFRHLAEVVQFKSWQRASWRKRLHGMTISPIDENTYRLMADLYRDFLCNFTSVLFNLNSDETWDLGKGRSRKIAKQIGVGRLYLRHIARLAELAHYHGRQPMIWADVIHRHPELIPEVPSDLILLDWGYSHDSPFDRCERLAELKRPFFVCPGTSGWNQVFNDVWNATLNIRRFVAAGKRYGALGVLNADWGDCGHFNMIGCSLHGAVLGAAMSWNEGRPDDESFDRAFSLHVFDDAKGEMGRAIRRAGSLIRQKTGKDLKTWELWASPIRDCQPGREISPQAIQSISETLNDLVETLALLPRVVRDRDVHSWLEISLGVAMLDSLAFRAQVDHEWLGMSAPRKKLGITYRQWADHALLLLRGIESNWKMRSKISDWNDIVRVFKKQIRDARAMSGRRKRC